MTVVRDQLFPQKPPGSRFRFSRTGVQPSPGSSTVELPSAFAESGAYPPDREPPGSPRQCSLPLACRHKEVWRSTGQIMVTTRATQTKIVPNRDKKLVTIQAMTLKYQDGSSDLLVVVVSHIQRIGCQPEKNYFTRWPIPLVVC